MPISLREHYGSVAASVLLHGLLVVGMVLASLMVNRRAPPDAQPLPIDAVVVDSQVFHAAQRVQSERIAEEAARVQAAAAAKAAAAAQAAAASEAAQAAADATATAIADARIAAVTAQRDEKAAAAAQAVEEAQRTAAAAKEADARQAAAAKQAAEAKRAAAAKQTAEAKQAADAKEAADAKRAADDRAKKDREAELRRQLADEEHTSAVESGPLRDRYITLLRNKIQGAWIKPPSARAGVDCLVEVTQVAGGEVTGARVTQCNGDAAVRQSIENAVYRSSPLPDPPDPALFERNFVFRFRPNE